MKIEVKYAYQEEVKVKSKARESLKNALISSFVLLVLALSAGAGYIFYVDHNSRTLAVVLPKTDTSQQYHVITPLVPDPKAAVGAAVELISSPVARGSSASATIKTYPGATCSIQVLYNKLASIEDGLSSKVADAYGIVSWNWNISSTTPEGSWPVNVTCAHHGLSGYVQGFVLVTAS